MDERRLVAKEIWLFLFKHQGQKFTAMQLCRQLVIDNSDIHPALHKMCTRGSVVWHNKVAGQGRTYEVTPACRIPYAGIELHEILAITKGQTYAHCA